MGRPQKGALHAFFEAGVLLKGADGDLSVGRERFASRCLLAHGVLEVALVWTHLLARLGAYPVFVVVFAAFGTTRRELAS